MSVRRLEAQYFSPCWERGFNLWGDFAARAAQAWRCAVVSIECATMHSKLLARLFTLLLFIGMLGSSVALAAGSPPAAKAAAPSAAPGTSAEDLERLVGTLQDDQQRQRLIKELQALIAAQRHEAPATEAETPADYIQKAAGRVQELGDDLVNSVTMILDAPHLLDGISTQWDDEKVRMRWAAIARHVAEILGTAVAAYVIVSLIIRGIRRRLVRPAGNRWASRLFLLAGQLALDALPVTAFVAAGEVMLRTVPDNYLITINVSSTVLGAVFVARMLLVLAGGILLAPREASWTLLRWSEESANYLYIWIRRFVFWVVYGFAFCACLWWLGVPGSISATAQKIVALVVTVLGVIFILQNRVAVAQWLRPHRHDRPGAGAEDGADAIVAEPVSDVPLRRRTVHVVRHRLADVWHVLVMVYLIAIFAVYALKIDGGFSFVFRSTMLTVVIFVTGRLLVRGIARITDRGFAIPQDLRLRFPTLEVRANRYLPILYMIASTVIWVFAGLSLLEVWGAGSYAWLGTTLGRRISGTLMTIGTILIMAFILWETINAAIDRYLGGANGTGAKIARSARVRTLLPLIRNVIWVTLLLVVVLLILSELGVNIAPLLGVSAVFGLAIGFGSQALVKDIITGLFILIEDTMAVGDVVDLGSGYSGVVEAISVRTIKLRDGQGTLHIIPFSEVTKVKNLSRDYAFHVIDLALPYSADPDQITEILKSIGEDMMADPTIGPSITAPLEVLGVTSFGLNGMQLQARIKTLPLKQWAVSRDFNRRAKKAFHAAGIGMPGAGQTIEFGDSVTKLIDRLRPVVPDGKAPEVEAGA
jgi:small-conductance mechanosensitive channel